MLYISRIRDFGTYYKYGVVDTDDDKEEFVMSKKLLDTVKTGVQIHGVVVREGMLREVIPYQDSRYCSPVQTKLSTMAGIDIVTYRGEVVSIRFDKLQKPFTLRLSDFAKSCGDAILMNASCWGGPVLTLVLDEKVKFNATTFKVFDKVPSKPDDDPSLKIDVRGVRKLASVEKVYRAANQSEFALAEWFVIDNKQRMNAMWKKYGYNYRG